MRLRGLPLELHAPADHVLLSCSWRGGLAAHPCLPSGPRAALRESRAGFPGSIARPALCPSQQGRALGWLNAEGVAFLQVPTYAVGYFFDADAYLRDRQATDRIEMHVLPRRDLYGLVEEAGCAVLEIREDGCQGRHGGVIVRARYR